LVIKGVNAPCGVDANKYISFISQKSLARVHEDQKRNFKTFLRFNTISIQQPIASTDLQLLQNYNNVKDTKNKQTWPEAFALYFYCIL